VGDSRHRGRDVLTRKIWTIDGDSWVTGFRDLLLGRERGGDARVDVREGGSPAEVALQAGVGDALMGLAAARGGPGAGGLVARRPQAEAAGDEGVVLAPEHGPVVGGEVDLAVSGPIERGDDGRRGVLDVDKVHVLR